jgi:PTS system nitrogen regulatory IIA component
MLLTNYIKPAAIIPDLQAANKAEVLKQLTHTVFEKKQEAFIVPALDQIMARETTESTGIGRGIAVPHARVSGLKNLVCAVGRIPDGLDFAAVDRKPVHLVFLICYPPTQQTTYLNFVATVAKLLRDGEHVKAILKADKPEEIHAILEKLSAPLEAPEEHYKKQLKADSDISKAKDAHADLILLARLQLCQEILETAKTGKRQINTRMTSIRSLVDERILKHYDKLMKGRAPALVSVEGDTCQGCFMRLPSQFVQRVRQDSDHIHTCSNCSRFIYIV